MTKAIIFDCDGTLVDSETLSAGVFAALLPEPGLFLHAAAALGTAARDCLVVEDSEAAVAAAHAAGMRVVVLHPGRAPAWLPAGVAVIEALAEVPAYL